jgi:NADH dehydrogenase FAD-containing subunit
VDEGEPLTRVVIIGGASGASTPRDAPVEVTVVDRRNFHLVQPPLYQVATGGLSPGNIAVPLRHTLRRHRNVRVLLGEATGRLQLAGYPAWLACLLVHLARLVPFGNKVLVLCQGAWNYLTFGRSARIIPTSGRE